MHHGERVLLPGLVDSHAHVYELGLKQLKADLEGATTEEELVARLRAFYPAPRPGEWLLGQGWFVVLEADPFRLPPERLASPRVLETWVRGRRVSARR